MKKYYILNRKAFLMRQTGIIEGCFGVVKRDGKITIDIRSLVEATDKELLAYKGIGEKRLAKLNSARKELIDLLLETK